MFKFADLVPFAGLIAPTNWNRNQVLQVDPPRYTRRPGFRFNLSCIAPEIEGEFWLCPGDDFQSQTFQQYTSLDSGQAYSLHRALKEEIALIQGPPGMGKTYLGVNIIQVLLANRIEANLGPIICVCYTNHALD